MSVLQLMATRGAGAAAWTPAQLSNKAGWWRASDITGKSDGDSVTAWPDSYGLLSDATGTGTYRTGVNGIGGVSAIEFNGTTNYFQTGYTGQISQFFAWVVVERYDTVSVQRAFLDKYFAGGFSLREDDTADRLRLIIQSNRFTPTPTSTTLLVAQGFDGSTWHRFVNEDYQSSSFSMAAFSNDELFIGSRVWGTGLHNGLIAEAGILENYPTTEELNNFFTYITNTYGIATS